MKQFLIIGLFFSSLFSFSQKMESDDKGTISLSWGYNRSFFTKSNIHFKGAGYDFTLFKVEAYDHPEPFTTSYRQVIFPEQFNIQVGYFIKHNWELSLSLARMRYIIADENRVHLSGTIDPQMNSTWKGEHTGLPVTTHRDSFHYENNVLNSARLSLTRIDNRLYFGRRRWLMISSMLGITIEGLISNNTFTFAQKKSLNTSSFSGYGFSINAGLRFEFFQRFFISTCARGGLHHQFNVKTRPFELNTGAKQFYGYFSFENKLGILLYLRPKKKCDSCPTW